LFRVAAGLDSAIAGESQVLHQLRRAYESAGRAVLDPVLRRLFERALHVGRDIRRTTGLGQVRRSVGSLAVDDVLAALDDHANATVLVIGAGAMGKLAVRALSRRVGRVIVANRDAARAEEVATVNGAEPLGLADVPGALATSDAVISAADLRGSLLTVEILSARLARGPLVLVDIAVPRSVAAGARELPGLRYRTVDDLADDNDAATPSDLALAEERCSREALAFMGQWRAREAVDTIREVRASAESLRHIQLERALRRLGHLPPRDRQVVEALSVGLTNSLLHAPTVALRKEPARSDTARELFGVVRRPL
jgi:glutamyl-tRNA reductase